MVVTDRFHCTSNSIQTRSSQIHIWIGQSLGPGLYIQWATPANWRPCLLPHLKPVSHKTSDINSDLTLFISWLNFLILSLKSDWSQKQHPTPGRTILHISLTWFCKLFSSSSCFRASSLTGTSASNFFRSCALIRRKVSGEMSPCGPVAARASSRGAVSVPLLAMSDNEARYPARAFFELHRSGVEVLGWSAWPTRTTNSNEVSFANSNIMPAEINITLYLATPWHYSGVMRVPPTPIIHRLTVCQQFVGADNHFHVCGKIPRTIFIIDKGTIKVSTRLNINAFYQRVLGNAIIFI